MANKTYWLRFGSGNPQSFSGLTPTLSTFITEGGTNLIGPTISEVGASTGLYKFIYDASPTFATGFVADGGAALASTDRYIAGVLDPISAVDQVLGFPMDSFGSTSIDPATAFGFLKRALEFWEGNATFIKQTGSWNIYSRGSSTLLREKALTNNTTLASKS